MVTMVSIPQEKVSKYETDMTFNHDNGKLFVKTYDDKNKGKPIDFMVYNELNENGELKGGTEYSVELNAEGEGTMHFTKSEPPYFYIVQIKDKSELKDKRVFFHY